MCRRASDPKRQIPRRGWPYGYRMGFTAYYYFNINNFRKCRLEPRPSPSLYRTPESSQHSRSTRSPVKGNMSYINLAGTLDSRGYKIIADQIIGKEGLTPRILIFTQSAPDAQVKSSEIQEVWDPFFNLIVGRCRTSTFIPINFHAHL